MGGSRSGKFDQIRTRENGLDPTGSGSATLLGTEARTTGPLALYPCTLLSMARPVRQRQVSRLGQQDLLPPDTPLHGLAGPAKDRYPVPRLGQQGL